MFRRLDAEVCDLGQMRPVAPAEAEKLTRIEYGRFESDTRYGEALLGFQRRRTRGLKSRCTPADEADHVRRQSGLGREIDNVRTLHHTDARSGSFGERRELHSSAPDPSTFDHVIPADPVAIENRGTLCFTVTKNSEFCAATFRPCSFPRK